MDFDDLIFYTVQMLKNDAEAREYYQKKFRYVVVDEYQDTSIAQFHLVRLLSGGYNNVCVVGDDDQSIYKFRGATIENILQFESVFAGAKTIRLEQNYRSTGNILDAANSVIQNNNGRKGKTLWTENGTGDKVHHYTASSEQDEASHIADIIGENLRARRPPARPCRALPDECAVQPRRNLLRPRRYPVPHRRRPALL